MAGGGCCAQAVLGQCLGRPRVSPQGQEPAAPQLLTPGWCGDDGQHYSTTTPRYHTCAAWFCLFCHGCAVLLQYWAVPEAHRKATATNNRPSALRCALLTHRANTQHHGITYLRCRQLFARSSERMSSGRCTLRVRWRRTMGAGPPHLEHHKTDIHQHCSHLIHAAALVEDTRVSCAAWSLHGASRRHKRCKEGWLSLHYCVTAVEGF
jgi:hypothetical protein